MLYRNIYIVESRYYYTGSKCKSPQKLQCFRKILRRETSMTTKILHPTEKYADEINNLPCKDCPHFNGNHLIKIGEKDIWVETETPDVEYKLPLKEWKLGFKCSYNGNEAANPTELRKGVCKYNH